MFYQVFFFCVLFSPFGSRFVLTPRLDPNRPKCGLLETAGFEQALERPAGFKVPLTIHPRRQNDKFFILHYNHPDGSLSARSSKKWNEAPNSDPVP